MREYVDIINLLMAGTPLNYGGKLFGSNAASRLRFDPVRKHIPIFIASLNRKSVEYTAQAADGWMPVMIPLASLGKAITEFAMRSSASMVAIRTRSRLKRPA